jgi:hypothetical protein
VGLVIAAFAQTLACLSGVLPCEQAADVMERVFGRQVAELTARGYLGQNGRPVTEAGAVQSLSSALECAGVLDVADSSPS